MKKCPKCGSGVTTYGSECYPEEGMAVECDNLDCDYEVLVSINVRVKDLKKIVENIHETMQRL